MPKKPSHGSKTVIPPEKQMEDSSGKWVMLNFLVENMNKAGYPRSADWWAQELPKMGYFLEKKIFPQGGGLARAVSYYDYIWLNDWYGNCLYVIRLDPNKSGTSGLKGKIGITRNLENKLKFVRNSNAKAEVYCYFPCHPNHEHMARHIIWSFTLRPDDDTQVGGECFECLHHDDWDRVKKELQTFFSSDFMKKSMKHPARSSEYRWDKMDERWLPIKNLAQETSFQESEEKEKINFSDLVDNPWKNWIMSENGVELDSDPSNYIRSSEIISKFGSSDPNFAKNFVIMGRYLRAFGGIPVKLSIEGKSVKAWRGIKFKNKMDSAENSVQSAPKQLSFPLQSISSTPLQNTVDSTQTVCP